MTIVCGNRSTWEEILHAVEKNEEATLANNISSFNAGLIIEQASH